MCNQTLLTRTKSSKNPNLASVGECLVASSMKFFLLVYIEVCDESIQCHLAAGGVNGKFIFG